MPNHQEFSSSYCNYVPAVLRHHKDNWQIEYYVYSPITKQLERKRIKVNRLRLHCTTLLLWCETHTVLYYTTKCNFISFCLQ